MPKHDGMTRSTPRESPHDARTDDHAARASPRSRNAARDLGSQDLESDARGLLREHGPRHALLRDRGDGSRAAVVLRFARSIARLYLTNLCKAATGEPGEAIPEIPPPVTDFELRDRTSAADDRAGVSESGSPIRLVGRTRFSHPERNRKAPRRSPRLSARAQPPVAIRRPRDAPPGREQAGPGVPVRVSGHVRQRPDTSRQGEA